MSASQRREKKSVAVVATSTVAVNVHAIFRTRECVECLLSLLLRVACDFVAVECVQRRSGSEVL